MVQPIIDLSPLKLSWISYHVLSYCCITTLIGSCVCNVHFQIMCNMKKIDVGDIEQEEPLLPEFPEPPVQQFVLERVLPSVTGVVRFSAAVTVAALSWIIPKYLNIRFK